MSGFYTILVEAFLGAFLAFIINLFSNWVWQKLFNKPPNKLIGSILMIIIFIITIWAAYIQYPTYTPTPSGIDYETANIKASWNNKGVALYAQGDYADAITCYDRAIEIDPEYTLAWSNRGNALKALHRDAEAEKAFAKARGEI